MMTAKLNRDQIASAFLTVLDLERTLVGDAKARSGAPPLPSLAVLYSEIATQEERHFAVLETIATRYGYTPTHSSSEGVGGTLGRLKDKVISLGAHPVDMLRQDLLAKSDAIHLQVAWLSVFTNLGDTASAQALETVIAEDQAQATALLEGLKRALEESLSPPEPA